jgi:hypothetical protein
MPEFIIFDILTALSALWLYLHLPIGFGLDILLLIPLGISVHLLAFCLTPIITILIFLLLLILLPGWDHLLYYFTLYLTFTSILSILFLIFIFQLLLLFLLLILNNCSLGHQLLILLHLPTLLLNLLPLLLFTYGQVPHIQGQALLRDLMAQIFVHCVVVCMDVT